MARPRNHLVIFLKAPQRGAVKTRLARAIGRAAAWRFYRETSYKSIRDLSGDPHWTVLLAVTPDRFTREGRFWPSDLPRLPQGRGDLGARMERPFRYLPPGPVVVVGGDIPDLRRRHVAQAFRLLRRVDVVFGPARDGGYWLIGHRRRPFAPRLFKDVTWSTEHAFAQTLANVPVMHTVERLEMLEDIDTGTAWRRWRSRTR